MILQTRFTENLAARARETVIFLLQKKSAKMNELDISTSVNGGKNCPICPVIKSPRISLTAPTTRPTMGPYIIEPSELTYPSSEKPSPDAMLILKSLTTTRSATISAAMVIILELVSCLTASCQYDFEKKYEEFFVVTEIFCNQRKVFVGT